MHRLLFPMLVLLMLSACKKSDPTYTMSINVNGNPGWTTTNISSQNFGNGLVYITGTSSDGNDVVVLSVYGYREGIATYTLHNSAYYNTLNPDISFATYQDGINVDGSLTGQVIVSADNTNSIQGSFDFYGSSTHVTGTFTAPKP